MEMLRRGNGQAAWTRKRPKFQTDVLASLATSHGIVLVQDQWPHLSTLHTVHLILRAHMILHTGWHYNVSRFWATPERARVVQSPIMKFKLITRHSHVTSSHLIMAE